MQNGRQTSLSLIDERQTFASRYDNRNYRISIRKLKTKQIMKREFKQGDRVLVRNNDLQEWQLRTLDRAGGDRWYPFVDTDDTAWSQCRHIDDFRTGDKVQVRSSMTEEWEDAVYGCNVPHDWFEHWVYSEDKDDLTCHKLCRWHPSMPWAEKEPLTLEEKVDKIWEQLKTNEQ